MATIVKVEAPDIPDFRDVPVIEVLVEPGDAISAEDPLVTLKSEKATMDVPAPVDGVVKEVKVNVGDRVPEGALILIAEADVAPEGAAPLERAKKARHSTASGAPAADAAPAAAPAPAASTYAGTVDIECEMLVLGAGIIGLEMATVYPTLGTCIDVVEMLDGMMAGADSDLVLVAVGRSANGNAIGAENAGVAVTDRGFIPVDRQMRTNVGHIFAIGDVVGQPMLAHKAVHEGHVAAEAAAGHKSFLDARQIPSVAYTDPEFAWAGLTEEQCKAQGIRYGKAVFPRAASGRAIANGRDEGFTKLLFDEASHRCIGGGIAGTHAGDLIGEVCLAVEMGCDPVDIGKTIHPHPTLCESIGMTAEVFEGVCTDLPPARKK